MKRYLRFSVFLLVLLFSMSSVCFMQRLYNKATDRVTGKIIYRPVFGACGHVEFEINPGAFKDFDSALCLIREITIGSGPDETFLSGSDLKGWSNTIYLTKQQEKGVWRAVHETGIK